MVIVYFLHLLWLIPASWIDCFLVRKKPFEVRCEHLSRWSKRMLRFLHVKLEVEMESELPKDAAFLIVSNHQSFVDLIMLEAGIPVPFTFVSKKENQKIPYLSSWSKNLEMIYFDRENQGSAVHMLRETTRRLKAGQNVLIFPEGTRSSAKEMNEMQAGSIQPAFLSKSYLLPVMLYNSFDYKQVVKHHGTLKMKIARPIPFTEYKPKKADGVIQELQIMMQETINNKN